MSIDIEALKQDLDTFESKKEGVLKAFFDKLYSDFKEIQPLFKDASHLENQLLPGLRFIVEHSNMPERGGAFVKDIGAAMHANKFNKGHLSWLRVTFLSITKEFAANQSGWDTLAKNIESQIAEYLSDGPIETEGEQEEAVATKPEPPPHVEQKAANSTADLSHEIKINLSEEIKNTIRDQVEQAFQAAVDREVSNAIREQYQKLNETKIKELVDHKLAS